MSAVKKKDSKGVAKEGGVLCFVCEKRFSCTSAMYRHLRNVHKAETTTLCKAKSVECRMCPGDDYFVCHNGEQLRQHMNERHRVHFQVDNFVFSSEQEFAKWKASVESGNVTYVKLRGSKRTADIETVTYNCNRSGFYKEIIKGPSRMRMMKVRGSEKINTYCPSKICAQIWRGEDESETVVTVEYNKTHVGHSSLRGHLDSADDGREWISARLDRDVRPNSIMNAIRQTMAGNVDGKHIVKRNYLSKVSKKYFGVCDVVEHGKGTKDVETFVNEVVSSSTWLCSSPILLCKPRGTLALDYVNELNGDDFVLVVMNESQKEMLLRFGPSFVCVDSFPMFDGNRFKLVTVMVLDEKNAAFPVAFALSNRVDEVVMTLSFKLIKDALGTLIGTRVFMSNDHDIHHKAWRNVMGEVDERQISSWHLDETWRKKLSKVKDTQKQIMTYKLLVGLLTDREATSFERSLSELVDQLRDDPDTAEFGRYFCNSFAEQPKKWAHCFRSKRSLVANVHLENLHKTLKYFLLAGNKVKRLDRSITAVMTFLRDTFFERLVDVRNEVGSEKLDAIEQRHAASRSLCEDVIVQQRDDTWLVQSSSNDGVAQTVSRNERVRCSCSFVCRECRSCIHEYSCTCIDSYINWNMCRHIHLVSSSARPDGRDAEEAYDGLEAEIVIHSQVATEEQDTEMSRKKSEILKRMETAMVQIEAVKKMDTLVFVDQLLEPFVSALDATLDIHS